VSGSVANPTGSVGGKSLTGLQDALTLFSGITEPIGTSDAQWQLVALLSNTASVCSRYVGGQFSYAPNEITLRIVVVGWAVNPASAPWALPAADLPLTLPVVDPPVDPATGKTPGTVSSDGVHRVLRPYVMQAGKNGRPGSDTSATSGTVTFTAISSTDPGKGQSGSYDLYFGTDHVAGSFVAPWC
jgi:hypothetical protein